MLPLPLPLPLPLAAPLLLSPEMLTRVRNTKAERDCSSCAPSSDCVRMGMLPPGSRRCSCRLMLAGGPSLAPMPPPTTAEALLERQRVALGVWEGVALGVSHALVLGNAVGVALLDAKERVELARRLGVGVKVEEGVPVLRVDVREEAVGREEAELEVAGVEEAGVCVGNRVPPAVPVPAAALMDAIPLPELESVLLSLLLDVNVAVPTPVALGEPLGEPLPEPLAVRTGKAVRKPLEEVLGLLLSEAPHVGVPLSPDRDAE